MGARVTHEVARRVAHWEIVLAEALEAAQARPFAWGIHDCANWALGVAHALGGPPVPRVGRYRTAKGAERVLRRKGWMTLEGLAQALLGAPLPMVLLAQRGDVVFSGEALGVCTGAAAAFVAPEGLTARRLRDCALAWRI